MEYLAVLAAALAGFAVGGVWYMVLSKHWVKAVGHPVKADGTPDGEGSPMPFIVLAVALILVAGMMRHVFAMSDINTVGLGLMSGVGIGAFFIAPWIAMNNAFGKRPVMLTVIDGGYAILGATVMAVVLTLF